MNQTVIVLNSNHSENSEMCRLLEKNGYLPSSIFGFNELENKMRKSYYPAVIIDVDAVNMENRQVRQISKQFPKTSLLFTSVNRIHPDLKESISQYVYACIIKPIDPDEILYWLKCSLEDNTNDNHNEQSKE